MSPKRKHQIRSRCLFTKFVMHYGSGSEHSCGVANSWTVVSLQRNDMIWFLNWEILWSIPQACYQWDQYEPWAVKFSRGIGIVYVSRHGMRLYGVKIDGGGIRNIYTYTTYSTKTIRRKNHLSNDIRLNVCLHAWSCALQNLAEMKFVLNGAGRLSMDKRTSPSVCLPGCWMVIEDVRTVLWSTKAGKTCPFMYAVQAMMDAREKEWGGLLSIHMTGSGPVCMIEKK